MAPLISLFLYLLVFFCIGCTESYQPLEPVPMHLYKQQIDSLNSICITIEGLQKQTDKPQKKLINATLNQNRIVYSLQLNDRPSQKAIHFQEVNQIGSLQNYQDDIAVQMSPNHQHFLLSFKGKAIAVYHLLDSGLPFSTCTTARCRQEQIVDFEQNSLESPQNLILEYLSQSKHLKKNSLHEKIATTLLGQSSPSILDFKLIEYLDHKIVQRYFEPFRIKTLCTIRDKRWRTTATKQVYRSVQRAKYAQVPITADLLNRAEGATQLYLNGLQNFMNNRDVERHVLPQYPLYSYTIKLFHNTEESRVLRKKEMHSIRDNCLKLLTDDGFRASLSHQKEAINEAIEFLISYRDHQNLERFEKSIAAIFRPKIANFHPSNLEDDILYPFHTRFSEAEQAIITRHSRRLIQQLEQGAIHHQIHNFLKQLER
jgi:hypothetical protein